MSNYPPPVYPKEDPERRKQVMERFYKFCKEQKWTDDDKPSKPRGRKPKPYQGPPPEYYKSKPKRAHG